MSGDGTQEFRTIVEPDGTVRIPAAYLEACGLQAGAQVSVRVTERVLSEQMRRRGISEEEIRVIGLTQLESRENVLAFLSSEGSLEGRDDLPKRFRGKG